MLPLFITSIESYSCPINSLNVQLCKHFIHPIHVKPETIKCLHPDLFSLMSKQRVIYIRGAGSGFSQWASNSSVFASFSMRCDWRCSCPLAWGEKPAASLGIVGALLCTVSSLCDAASLLVSLGTSKATSLTWWLRKMPVKHLCQSQSGQVNLATRHPVLFLLLSWCENDDQFW